MLSKQRKQEKRDEANARQAKYGSLSPTARLNRIMDRTGLTPEQVLNTREARKMIAAGHDISL